MGTLVQIVARGAVEDTLRRAVDDAWGCIDQVDRLMSFHRADSELSLLNRTAAGLPVRVHPWLYKVLRSAIRVSQASGGLFDITVAPVLVRAGWLPGETGALPNVRRWRDLRLLTDYRISFQQPMLIDLGGIAKGFAVDMAIHALRRAGCEMACVNAGGDLRRFGVDYEPIHARTAGGLIPVALLRSGALATSAAPDAQPDRLQQPIGCIMDPRSETPWRPTGAVMVAARTCMMADALTKVAALAGASAQPMLARFGAQARWLERGSQGIGL